MSLKDSPRRDAFAARARAHALRFDFVDAVGAADLRRGAGVEDCRIDLTELRWTWHERHDPRRQLAPLLFSEIGCAYSHIRCWRLARQQDLEQVCIFEDDAVICRSLDDLSMPRDADILYISDRMPRNLRGEASGTGSGTEGYVLSRAGVRKCLEIFKVLYMPVDLQLIAHQWGNIRRGLEIARHRRDIGDEFYLNAAVARLPYCRHPDEAEPQVGGADLPGVLLERDRLRLDLAALRNSTSWRLTAPLRALRRLFR